MGIALTLLTSRTGIAIMVVTALLAWHTLDKSSAVRKAVDGYVAGSTISALKAEIEEASRRGRIVEQENERLSKQIADASAAEADQRKELDDYQKATAKDGNAILTGDLIKRLRNR